MSPSSAIARVLPGCLLLFSGSPRGEAGTGEAGPGEAGPDGGDDGRDVQCLPLTPRHVPPLVLAPVLSATLPLCPEPPLVIALPKYKILYRRARDADPDLTSNVKTEPDLSYQDALDLT
jgi:hypothetical protein